MAKATFHQSMNDSSPRVRGPVGQRKGSASSVSRQQKLVGCLFERTQQESRTKVIPFPKKFSSPSCRCRFNNYCLCEYWLLSPSWKSGGSGTFDRDKIEARLKERSVLPRRNRTSEAEINFPFKDSFDQQKMQSNRILINKALEQADWFLPPKQCETKSLLLGKLLALDLPLEHERKTLLNHTHDNP
ncbi:hypothetical protein M5K25_028277 [Dendrobium thyrsiflorum]|uniref:Uncharacterized protein n=1 Tax=Dendrobium thyrsiflorum TaxID=117978 RepID=A0ABD0TTN4_DENTH